MRKLLKGIVEFRKNSLPDYKEKFAQLALGQSPDTLFIACSDSRVVPNLFASTDPGDLFVVRNVGNLVSPCGSEGVSKAGFSVAAAIEFAVSRLNVQHIIICGHSECGAMQAVASDIVFPDLPNLSTWLENCEIKTLPPFVDKNLSPHNQLSQSNVLLQIENVKSYPLVRERVEEGILRLHGWWFDIASAEVRAFDPEVGRYVSIDEQYVAKALKNGF